MHTIRPLETLSREEVRAMAHAASDRHEPVATANPFPTGSVNATHFEKDHKERSLELCAA